jgi:hypothetical protein
MYETHSNTTQQLENGYNTDDHSHGVLADACRPHRGSPPTRARLRDAKTTQRPHSAPVNVFRHSRGYDIFIGNYMVCMYVPFYERAVL